MAVCVTKVTFWLFGLVQVKLSVIKNYLTAATTLFPTTAFVSLAAFVVAQVCTNIWLSKWTNQPVYNGTVDRDQTNIYLGVYGALGVAQSKKLVMYNIFK